MIASLTGTVRERTASSAIIEVAGVGYRLLMSTGSLASLPAAGDDVTVHTHLHVRDDELTLYGFESRSEQEAFELLITVSGVGPKVALSVLSALAPDALSAAVSARDVAALSSVPGIGKKTAERLCLELSDKMGAPGDGAAVVHPASDEATAALLGMGFTSAEAAAALAGFDGDRSDAQVLLKHALSRLGSPR